MRLASDLVVFAWACVCHAMKWIIMRGFPKENEWSILDWLIDQWQIRRKKKKMKTQHIYLDIFNGIPFDFQHDTCNYVIALEW